MGAAARTSTTCREGDLVQRACQVGAMVIPRDPEGSNLIWLLPEVRMPHGKKKLSICVQSGRRPSLAIPESRVKSADRVEVNSN